jgi:hypothetical protein
MALSTRLLVAVTATWVVVAPVVSHLLRSQLPPPSYDDPSLASLGRPGELVRELLVTGYYPTLTWLPYLLLGILVARLDLRRAGTAGVLAAGGALAVGAAWSWSTVLLAHSGVRAELVRTFAGASWRHDLDTTLGRGLHGTSPTGSLWWLAVDAPHTGTTFDLLMTGGSACLVLGGCLAVGCALPRLSRVAFGAGAMTLTLYTLHVVLLRPDGFADGHDPATFLLHASLVLTIGAVVRALGRRGPLELAVGRAGTAAREAVTGRR